MGKHHVFIKLKPGMWISYHSVELNVNKEALMILFPEQIILERSQNYSIRIINCERLKIINTQGQIFDIDCMSNINLVDDLKRNDYAVTDEENIHLLPSEPKPVPILAIIVILVLFQFILLIVLNVLKQRGDV